MLPFVSTASNLTAATQMSAAAKTENTMRANQKNRKRKWAQIQDHDYAVGVDTTEKVASHALCWMIASLDGPR